MNRNDTIKNKGYSSYGLISIAILLLMHQHELHTHHDMHKDLKKSEMDASKRGRRT